MSRTSKRVVLIVDQDGTVRLLLHAALRDAGYAVLSATNGQDALSVLEHVLPDLLVLDLFAPVIDGRRLLAELCRRGLVIPSIMLVPSETNRAAATALGVDTVVVKPFHLDHVVSLVRYACPLDQPREASVATMPAVGESSRVA